MGDSAKSYMIKSAPAGRGIDWLVDSFAIFSNNWLAWIGVVVFLSGLSLLSNLFPLLAGLFLLLVSPVFIGGLMVGCAAVDHGEDFTFEHLFSCFSLRFNRLLLVGVVHILGVVIILVICGGILISVVGGKSEVFETLTAIQSAIEALDVVRISELIIPYLQILLLVELIALALYVPLLVLVWFAPALIVLDNIDPVQAMKDSFTGCMKNMMPYLVYGIIGLIFSVIATIPLGLGWLVLGPMMIASIYLAYKDIYQKT